VASVIGVVVAGVCLRLGNSDVGTGVGETVGVGSGVGSLGIVSSLMVVDSVDSVGSVIRVGPAPAKWLGE